MDKGNNVKPNRFSKSQLAKVGVQIVNESSCHLKCQQCGKTWSPNIQPGGRLPARYWQCPNQCNMIRKR